MLKPRTMWYAGLLIPVITLAAVGFLSDNGALADVQHDDSGDLGLLNGAWTRPGIKRERDPYYAPLDLRPRERECDPLFIPLLMFAADKKQSLLFVGHLSGLNNPGDKSITFYNIQLAKKDNVKIILLERGNDSVEVGYLITDNLLELRANKKIDVGGLLGTYDISGKWVRWEKDVDFGPSRPRFKWKETTSHADRDTIPGRHCASDDRRADIIQRTTGR